MFFGHPRAIQGEAPKQSSPLDIKEDLQKGERGAHPESQLTQTDSSLKRGRLVTLWGPARTLGKTRRSGRKKGKAERV